jgi:succinyl-CoA synthetase beta subunit
MDAAHAFATKMGFSPACIEQAAEWIMSMYKVFIERDAVLLEINPMSEDLFGRGTVCCDYHNSTTSQL